jgi:hypothetical protein
MQHVHASTLLIVFTLLAGCASSIDQDLSFRSDPQFVVTYYDRNGDGSVDFAFYHIPDSDDMDYALVDTHFTGRFDLKIHYGIAVGEYRLVHPVPVPAHVRIERGRLPVIYRERPNQAMQRSAVSSCTTTGARTTLC